MAGFTEKISVIIDVTTDKASKGIKDFKSSVSEAEGFTGKFKSGIKSLGAQFGAVASSPVGLAAGIGAVSAVALQAAEEFTNLAKTSMDLASATGLSTEEASRWIAVADDFGIEASALQSGLGKISKSLDDAKWDKYGIATRDAAGNARSANDILLDSLAVLGNIDNATQRAKVGQELFGKGFANLAPMVGKTRAEYDRYLKSVGRGQVITAEEAKKAEEMRLAQDAIADSMKEVQLAIGKTVAELAPLIQKTAEQITALTDMADKFGVVDKVVGGLDWATPTGFVNNLTSELTGGISAAEGMGMAWDALFSDDTKSDMHVVAKRLDTVAYAEELAAKGAEVLADKAELANDELETMADRAKGAEDAFNDFIGALDDEDAWNDIIAKMYALNDGLGDTSQESRDAKRAVAEYIHEFEGIPSSVKTSLYAKLDKGAIAEVNAYLSNLRNGVVVPLYPKGFGSGNGDYGSGIRASGGQVRAGQPYKVGEQGEEMFVPGVNGVVVPHGVTRGMGGGGGYNITVNAGMGANGAAIGDAVVAAIKQYERRNGNGWRS